MKDKLLALSGIKTTPTKLKRQGSTKSLAIENQTPPSGLSRKGSVTSLKSLGLSSPFKKKDKSVDNVEEDSFDEGWGTMKKRFGRRLSSLFDSPTKLGSVPRRHSLSTLSITSTATQQSQQGRISEAQLLQLDEDEPRPVLRKDLPVCWLDQTQVKNRVRQTSDEDILSRLITRPYTRHLARLVISYTSHQDLKNMFRVSKLWQQFLSRELPSKLLIKIKS
eukprot:GFUD01040734.1.p1 GENE.GFUD01040734.1~~GFUD01040734.1.p1  ORF type:complete len:221 (+),score=61.95 GFUD01040734.1:137-799(+)